MPMSFGPHLVSVCSHPAGTLPQPAAFHVLRLPDTDSTSILHDTEDVTDNSCSACRRSPRCPRRGAARPPASWPCSRTTRRLAQSGPARARRHAGRAPGAGRGRDQVPAPLGRRRAPQRTPSPPASTARPADYPGWGPFDGLFDAARARGFRVMIALGAARAGLGHQAARRPSGRRPSQRHRVRPLRRGGRQALPRRRHLDAQERAQPPAASSTRSRPRGASPTRRGSTARWCGRGPPGWRARATAATASSSASCCRSLPAAARPAPTLRPLLFLREFFCLDSRCAPTRPRRPRPRLHRLPPHHRRERLRLPPLHAARRPAHAAGLERQRHDPLARPHHPRARHRAPPRTHRRRHGWRLEHGVRLPVQPARPLPGPGSRASRASCNEAEWISYRNPRVASFSQYTLTDDPLGRAADASRHAGRAACASRRAPKPGVYDAFRLPLFVRLLGPARGGGLGRRAARRRRRAGAGAAALRRRAFANLGRPDRRAQRRAATSACATASRAPRAAASASSPAGLEPARAAKAVTR